MYGLPWPATSEGGVVLKAIGTVRELRLWLPEAARIQAVRELQQRITEVVGGVTQYHVTGIDSDGLNEPVVYLHWFAFHERAAVNASMKLRELVLTLLTEAHQNSVLVDYGTGDGPILYYYEPVSD